MTNTHSDDLVARYEQARQYCVRCADFHPESKARCYEAMKRAEYMPGITVQLACLVDDMIIRREELERENADRRHDIERHIGIATEANQEADTLARALYHTKTALPGASGFLKQNEHTKAIAIANRRINGEK